jgi:hypothetical protein
LNVAFGSLADSLAQIGATTAFERTADIHERIRTSRTGTFSH